MRERLALLGHLRDVSRLARTLRRAPAPPPRPAGAPLRVALLPSTPASNVGMKVRVFDWVPHLERRGFRAEVLPPCTEEAWAAFSGKGMEADREFHGAVVRTRASQVEAILDSDVVLLHRGLLPFSPYRRATLECLLARRHPGVVFDFFDSLWESTERLRRRTRSPLARWLNPEDALGRSLAASARVTVSSGYLAEYALRWNPRTSVVPMLLDAGSYAPVVHGPRKPPVFGWMGNEGNLDRLQSVAGALAKAPLRLVVVSSAPVAAPGLEVELRTHPWTPESERADLATFDVGILPMFDDAVDRGKSPLKLLQYAAAGLPILASPVAIDRSLWIHGRNILFATTPEEWTAHASALAADPGLRASLGAEARRLVEREFTHSAWADRFADLLRGAAGR